MSSLYLLRLFSCAEVLTLAEISAKLTTHGALRKDIDLRRLGAIMKKLGFVQARDGELIC